MARFISLIENSISQKLDIDLLALEYRTEANLIAEKFKSFGWNVIEICAHSFDEIDAAFNAAAEFKGKPSAIIANSVKGKGVSFMEDQVSWHGTAPNAEQYEQAMAELTQALAELEA